ncbi:MAG TPA: hypothetical protein PLF13_09685 [candidate division Zixibacteria bacterium]|nr:hypothetical protein [candidate division Zixibacteria bacterium]
MARLSKKKTLMMVVMIVFGLALVSAAHFTSACRLQTVVLDNQPVEQWQETLSPLSARSILRQPLDSLAGQLLRRPEVYKVDMNFSGLRTLKIETNDFNPVCVLLDKASGKLCGLAENGRLLPLKNSPAGWECPIITGLKAWKTFTSGEDGRVPVVVNALQVIRHKHKDLYRLIGEVYMHPEGHIELTIEGLDYRVRLMPARFVEGIDRFVDFITRYSPGLDKAKYLDVRFDNMIVCVEGK